MDACIKTACPLTLGGIPKKNYEPLKRFMLHEYGPPVLLLLINMETAGLLYRKEDKQKGGFPAVRKALPIWSIRIMKPF